MGKVPGGDAPYAQRPVSPRQQAKAMSKQKTTTSYLTGSAPDVVERLHHALEATQSARVLMRSSIETLELHLEHLDDHLRRLIADIEGRAH
jgi:hypothetical protein